MFTVRKPSFFKLVRIPYNASTGIVTGNPSRIDSSSSSCQWTRTWTHYMDSETDVFTSDGNRRIDSSSSSWTWTWTRTRSPLALHSSLCTYRPPRLRVGVGCHGLQQIPRAGRACHCQAGGTNSNRTPSRTRSRSPLALPVAPRRLGVTDSESRRTRRPCIPRQYSGKGVLPDLNSELVHASAAPPMVAHSGTVTWSVWHLCPT
jgi:hypothetical protein